MRKKINKQKSSIFIIGIIILLALILVFLSIKIREGLTRPAKRVLPLYKGGVRNDGSIFVSVASYRDRLCSTTVANMFAEADRPDILFAGIVQQNKYDPKTSKEDCSMKDVQHKGNVSLLSLDYTEARGPCYARYICSTLYRGQTFFLQIDSHTTFVKGWDTKLRTMFTQIPDNGVISYYPNSAYNEKGEKVKPDDEFISYIKSANLDTDPNMPVFLAQNTELGTMQPSVGVAGGFMAMPGEVLMQVPFDSGLDNLFMGEELLYAARLFTSGYDVFSPSEHLAFHFYTRGDEPKYWTDLVDYNKSGDNPKEFVYRIMGLRGNKPMYGQFQLGQKRSIEQYYDLLKMNPETLAISKSDGAGM